VYDIRIRREDAVKPKTLPPDMYADIVENEPISDAISQYPNIVGKKTGYLARCRMLYRCNIVISEYRYPICSTHLLLLRLDAPATVLLHRQDLPRDPQHALRCLRCLHALFSSLAETETETETPDSLQWAAARRKCLHFCTLCRCRINLVRYRVRCC
jgi:hypothetical protein